MINVGRIVVSRNFAQPNGYMVYRTTGDWVNGRWVDNPEVAIKMDGTITVANVNDLVQVPEGDRVIGLMCFYATIPLYTTRAAVGSDLGGISDEIAWQGDRYRVSSVSPWSDFGYCKAFGTRMAGN